MPLSIAPAGKKMLIKKISGNSEIKHHLGSLGFVPGSELTIISMNGSNMIVNVKNTRIALHKSLANQIIL